MKNPTIATLLNIIPGLGYIYIGGKRRMFGIILIITFTLIVIAGNDPLMSTPEYDAMRTTKSEKSRLKLRIKDLC